MDTETSSVSVAADAGRLHSPPDNWGLLAISAPVSGTELHTAALCVIEGPHWPDTVFVVETLLLAPPSAGLFLSPWKPPSCPGPCCPGFLFPKPFAERTTIDATPSAQVPTQNFRRSRPARQAELYRTCSHCATCIHSSCHWHLCQCWDHGRL